MKNGIFALAVLALLLASIGGVSFAENGPSLISLSVAKYEPFPAEAGQYVELWLKVENLGSGTANDVVVEALPQFPFSLEGQDAVKSLGAVSSGSAPLISYRLKIDEKATSGNNILQLRYRPALNSAWVTKDVEIYVQIHDAIISVSGMSAENMIPGKTQTVSISLENMANTYLKDVAVSLDFSATTLPFATIDSLNEKRIVGIPSKDKANISFEIITSPDAASGVYKVPLTLKYSDITNKNYTRQYLVGLVVNSAPDFQIGLQKYDALTAGATGTVTISISNTGPGTIKFMTMDIVPSDKYEAFGEKSIYLGNLNPDDYQTGAFKIFVSKSALEDGAKTIPIKLHLKYRDGLNNIYTKDTALDMRVYTPAEISAYGLGAPGSSNTTLYVIIAAAAIYFIYKKYFKKKSKV